MLSLEDALRLLAPKRVNAEEVLGRVRLVVERVGCRAYLIVAGPQAGLYLQVTSTYS